MDDVLYIELNNWRAGEGYPDEEPFTEWMSYNNNGPVFGKDEWAKENELCVVAFLYDMSQTFCITAKKSWVKDKCPNLFNYPEFLRKPDENNEIESYFGGYF